MSQPITPATHRPRPTRRTASVVAAVLLTGALGGGVAFVASGGELSLPIFRGVEIVVDDARARSATDDVVEDLGFPVALVHVRGADATTTLPLTTTPLTTEAMTAVRDKVEDLISGS